MFTLFIAPNFKGTKSDFAKMLIFTLWLDSMIVLFAIGS